MSNKIVNITITQQVGSQPSNLQQTGAIVSQGGTTTAVNTLTLITQPSDLTPVLAGAETLASLAWASSVVTATTSTPHGIPIGDIVQGTISGVTPTGYNGTFAITSTGASSFTYPLVTNPGSVTIEGSFTLADVAELTAQISTWFGQGQNNAVYVLELGVGTTAQGVTALAAYIAAPPAPVVPIYAYMVPKEWDTEATAPTMMNTFVSPTSKIYFYVTTTVATYTNWTGIKSVIATAPSPNAPITEFSASAVFWDGLNNNPSASNLMEPMQYSFVYGVTPYNTLTGAQITALKAAGVNWIGTGAEGQISNTLIKTGGYMDLNPFTYWYAIDWVNINCDISLSAAVINGSNTPTNPLDYAQSGINTLQKVAQQVMNNGVSFGLLAAGAVVNATAFVPYITANPSNYTAGIYGGLSGTFSPQKGFTSITMNLTAVALPT
jgi:hypothetical protein